MRVTIVVSALIIAALVAIMGLKRNPAPQTTAKAEPTEDAPRVATVPREWKPPTNPAPVAAAPEALKPVFEEAPEEPEPEEIRITDPAQSKRE